VRVLVATSLDRKVTVILICHARTTIAPPLHNVRNPLAEESLLCISTETSQRMVTTSVQPPSAPAASAPEGLQLSGQLDMHYFLTEGLEGIDHHMYKDIRSFKTAVDTYYKALRSAKSDEHLTPYLIFSPVTAKQLERIDHERNLHHKKLRILYLNKPQVLIVKMTISPFHDMVVWEFLMVIWEKIIAMGLTNDIITMGRTTYEGEESAKEADASLRPLRTRPDLYDWPTLVIECGGYETPRRLAADGRWWLHSSSGAVKVVLLLFISTKAKTIRIEQCELDRVENP